MSGVAAFVVCGGYIEILGSYCVRFEPVVSESCSLKCEEFIYIPHTAEAAAPFVGVVGR